RAVTAPLTPSDSVVYDTRCNPRLERSPGGAVDTIAADILGRVTHTTSPMGVVDSMTYDAMDRVLTKLTIGPARGSAPSETVAVTMAYDSVGRDTMVTRTINPDPAGVRRAHHAHGLRPHGPRGARDRTRQRGDPHAV